MDRPHPHLIHGSDAVLQLFLDSLTDQAVFTVDLDGVIDTWSDGCRRLKGYTAEEAIGHHLRMIYTPEDQARGHAEDNLRMALEDGQYHEERIRIRKGGEAFVAEVSIYPLHEDGRAVGFSKIVRDITDRKRLENERDELDRRLKAANQELEGFCNSVAHDLRTPIHAIVSRCGAVLDDPEFNLSVETKGQVEALRRSGKRLARLVDDLLTFARLGQGEVTRRDVDFSALARRIADEIVPNHHAGQVNVEVEDGIRAHGDKSMIDLVLRNLIENSCKYSNAGVHIHVAAGFLDGEFVYSVKDDGIGFDMEYVDRIFEPFQRLHGVGAYSGTGIGLANVRRIVERHGGRIWAQSMPGKGAKFSFTLA